MKTFKGIDFSLVLESNMFSAEDVLSGLDADQVQPNTLGDVAKLAAALKSNPDALENVEFEDLAGVLASMGVAATMYRDGSAPSYYRFAGPREPVEGVDYDVF